MTLSPSSRETTRAATTGNARPERSQDKAKERKKAQFMQVKQAFVAGSNCILADTVVYAACKAG